MAVHRTVLKSFPGDIIDIPALNEKELENNACKVRLGSGVFISYRPTGKYSSVREIKASLAGDVNILESANESNNGNKQKRKNITIFELPLPKRYLPKNGDLVIGIVEAKMSDYFRLSINSTLPAELPMLAFPYANRKNRPNFNVGVAVLCRVVKAEPSIMTEVTCIPLNFNSNLNSNTTADANNPQDGGLGELIDGYIFNVSLQYANQLLNPSPNDILDIIGEKIPFEIVIGRNGKIWVSDASKSIKHTMGIARAIIECEGAPNYDVLKSAVHSILASFM